MTDSQMDSVKEFREAFKKQHIDPPSSHYENFDERDVALILNDDLFAPALVSRQKGNLESAVKSAVEILEWRKKNQVNDITLEEICKDFYKLGIVFLRGRSKEGSRILTFVGNRYTKEHEPNARKLLIYLLERIRRSDPGTKVLFILDAGKCSWDNVDMSIIRLMVDLFMQYFPGMLERIWIVDIPSYLTVVWKMVSVWFNEELRQRTDLCKREELVEHADVGQLHEILGGEDSWIPTSAEEDCNAEFQDEEESFADAVENLAITQE